MIQRLSESTIRHIAAGEVIESPVDVVKELIENSLDAHATRISISIQDGGITSITVTDDGVGMSAENLMRSVENHTTDKLVAYEDIYKLHSYGFRGEALANIALTSDLLLHTYDGQDMSGHSLACSPLHPPRLTPFARSVGTTARVNRLFEHLPSKRKFLSSKRTYTTTIIQVVTHFALSHPNVSFLLEGNGKSLLRTYKATSPKEVIHRLYHIPLADMKELTFTHPHADIRILYADPAHAQKNKKAQWVFVNGRNVQNSSMRKAVEEALSVIFPPSFHPLYMVSLTLPEVDVNVHPRKDVVRIEGEDLLASWLRERLRAAVSEERIKTTFPLPSATLHQRRVLGQLQDMYILCESEGKLSVIDQHAAHEAILDHELTLRWHQGRLFAPPLPLETPLHLSLSSEERLRYAEVRDAMTMLGITSEPFGPKDIRITRALPAFSRDEILDAIREILHSSPGDEATWFTDAIASLSCRGAIKAGSPLAHEEMEHIMNQLQEYQLTNCPHGRPLTFDISFEDLEKRFKRRR